ncbi:hypothetical protein CHUAL_002661 [Chamberlinius hualienensis]
MTVLINAMLQSLAYTAAAQNGSPPSLSSPSSNYDICRICHCEAETDAPLIAPCYCSGSLLYVHQSCLQQWIKSSDTRKCELCKFEFIMQTKVKPFTQWEKLDITAVERRKIFCSVTFHVVAITCVIWSLYVLIDRTAQEVRSGVLEWPFWTKLIVVAIGFTGGLVFMYVQCKMYVQLCRRWKAFNRIIYIQNAPTKAFLASTLNDNNLGNINGPALNSVPVYDHSLQPQPPHFSPITKCELPLTTTTATCVEMTNPRMLFSDEKQQQQPVVLGTPSSPSPSPPQQPSSPTPSLPPPTSFGLSLLIPSSDNMRSVYGGSVNNNNNIIVNGEQTVVSDNQQTISSQLQPVS